MPLLKSWNLIKRKISSSKGSRSDQSSKKGEEKKGETCENGDGTKSRHWKTDAQFLLAAIGSAVGLGNILRFPNLCYKYNGFGFLLPYLFAVIFIGVPVLGMECMFGQITQRSAVKAFSKIKPFLWGLGAYVTWAAFMVVSYYNVIMAWSLQYLYYSFQSPLPWGDTTESARNFFYDKVLRMQDEDGDLWTLSDGMGTVNGPLVFALFAQWLLVFFCIYNLTKTVQFVVLVTVPLPFILIAVMAIYGLTREGSTDGVMAYIDPTNNPSALFSLQAWVDAAGQIFFGLSLSVGVMICYSSHQPAESKVVRNSWIIALGNSVTSIIAGFAVFGLLGHFAHSSGVELSEVATSGYILSFETFPATFANFAGKGASQSFSVLFFLTLILLGVDSAMSLVEAVCEAFTDNSNLCRKHVPLVVLFFCTIGFLFSIIMATKSGYYVLDILDHFSSNYLMLMGEFSLSTFTFTLPFLLRSNLFSPSFPGGGLSAIAVGWFYPAEKLVREVKAYTGEDAFWLPFLWTYLCKYLTPAILILLFGYNFVIDCMRPYNEYPQWALVCFGWIPCLVVPTLAFAVPSLIWPNPNFLSSTESESNRTGQELANMKLPGADVEDLVDTVRSNTSVVTMESMHQEV